ncbi:hypothetical protein IWX85_002833 [Polaromonas sp. CG_9.11]|nr:hypothetical protein [Polaromonas sp. CG_9.11]
MNIGANAKVCLSFIDIFVQKGFKIIGTATDLKPSAPEFSKWAGPLHAMVGDCFPIPSVFVVCATSVHRIIAPSYAFYPSETTEESQVQSALRNYGAHRRVGHD